MMRYLRIYSIVFLTLIIMLLSFALIFTIMFSLGISDAITGDEIEKYSFNQVQHISLIFIILVSFIAILIYIINSKPEKRKHTSE